MANTTILIVDDDEHMLEMLNIHIENIGYSVLKAANGQDALQIIETTGEQLSAIISDVEMPQLDGYELCRAVRNHEKLKEIPFIFISAKKSLPEKLKGYDVGGDEYITKPLDGEEVVLKVRHIIENRIRHCSLTQQIQDSHQAAMQAMTYTSNLGQVLQFMQATARTNEIDELAGKLFDVGLSLGLSMILQFHTPGKIINFKQPGDVTPLEANVIELARHKGRFFDFGCRTIINYSDFSLLILNMPVADAEKYGLMKDILGNLCDAIEVRLKLLLSKAIVEHKDDVIQTVTQALDTIDKSYRDIQQANMSVIDEMIRRMEEAMFGFGLSETQEDVVRGIVQFMKTKMSEVYEDGTELYNEFEKIHDTLVTGLK